MVKPMFMQIYQHSKESRNEIQTNFKEKYVKLFGLLSHVFPAQPSRLHHLQDRYVYLQIVYLQNGYMQQILQ